MANSNDGTTQKKTVFTILLVLAFSSMSYGQIFVTTSADVTDVTSDATISDLPGPDGVTSFREALRASDNEPGIQTIGFQIPEDDWYLPDIFSGHVLIQGSFNWSAFDAVVIDGETQTAFTGDTNPDGHEVVLYGLEFVINGDGSQISGLDSSHITLFDCENCIVRNNTGDMGIEASLGGAHLISDNQADTIELSYSNFNLVQGNTTQRIRLSGGGPIYGPATGNRIGGPRLQDRNFVTGWGNYGEHGFPAGMTIDLYGTSDTIIENNFVGTTPDGLEIGNAASTTGIGIVTDNRQLIIRNNLIVTSATHANGTGVFGSPIYIDGYEGATDIEIYGNTLGLNANGEAVLGGLHGIWINDSIAEFVNNITIGGSEIEKQNVIAGHASTGILLEGAPGITPVGGIRINKNLIYANGDIGIDLMPNTWDFGHTENDILDSDSGANYLQNYPELEAALQDASSFQIAGDFNSRPSRQYTLEFFGTKSCYPNGVGQAEVFVGAASVTTDEQGNAQFETTFAVDLKAYPFVCATATDNTTNATSEFSRCVDVRIADYQPGDINRDGVVDLLDVSPFVDLLTGGTYQIEGDMNQDGSVDLLDVQLFVDSVSA